MAAQGRATLCMNLKAAPKLFVVFVLDCTSTEPAAAIHMVMRWLFELHWSFSRLTWSWYWDYSSVSFVLGGKAVLASSDFSDVIFSSRHAMHQTKRTCRLWRVEEKCKGQEQTEVRRGYHDVLSPGMTTSKKV